MGRAPGPADLVGQEFADWQHMESQYRKVIADSWREQWPVLLEESRIGCPVTGIVAQGWRKLGWSGSCRRCSSGRRRSEHIDLVVEHLHTAVVVPAVSSHSSHSLPEA